MLDRIHARLNRLLDSRCAMGMRGNLSSKPVCFGDDCANLFVAELLGAWRIAFGQHPACRSDLYTVGAVFDYLARLGNYRGNTISDAVGFVVKFGRQQADIDMTSRRSDGWPGSNDPGAGNIARVYCVAQRDVGITVGPDIAHRSETCFESHACIP